MRLLLDEMISNQVAERLKGDVVAVTADAGLRGLDDPGVFAEAQSTGLVVVTYNVRDFEPMGREWVDAGREHAGLVFVSNATIPQGDLARLTKALDGFLTSFTPWPSFAHWLFKDG